MKFKVGTKVKCLNNLCREENLTEGREYQVIHSYESFIYLVDDLGELTSFIPERFEVANPPLARVIENEQVYMFDVDDTLILWDDQIHRASADRIEIHDPYDNVTVYVKPHERHVKLLTQMKGRGRFICVWSQSGVKWAQAVVDALGLTDSVDLILTKPQGYVDDLHCSEWMKNQIYIKGDE